MNAKTHTLLRKLTALAGALKKDWARFDSIITEIIVHLENIESISQGNSNNSFSGDQNVDKTN